MLGLYVGPGAASVYDIVQYRNCLIQLVVLYPLTNSYTVITYFQHSMHFLFLLVTNGLAA